MTNMKKLGIEIRLASPHTTVIKEADGSLTLHLDVEDYKMRKINTDKVLIALGRPPNVDGLCLQNTGIKTENGAVIVDEYQNTTVKGVYAIGDVIKKIDLTPVAIRAGRILSERLFNGKTNLKMHYNNVATVIFSHPPIGSIGINENDAKKIHGETNIVVYKSSFVNMFYSLAKDP